MQLSATATEAARETRFVEMVFPGLSNHYGTLFGGDALKLMGKAAFVAAARHARCKVVMAASDRIEFHQPIPMGQVTRGNFEMVAVNDHGRPVALAQTAKPDLKHQLT